MPDTAAESKLFFFFCRSFFLSFSFTLSNGDFFFSFAQASWHAHRHSSNTTQSIKMYWHVAPCVLFVSCITHSLIHHPTSKYKEVFVYFSNRILSYTPKTRLNQQAMIVNSRVGTREQTRLVRKRARNSTDQSIRQSVRGSSSGAAENPLYSPHFMPRAPFHSSHTKCKALFDFVNSPYDDDYDGKLFSLLPFPPPPLPLPPSPFYFHSHEYSYRN